MGLDRFGAAAVLVHPRRIGASLVLHGASCRAGCSAHSTLPTHAHTQAPPRAALPQREAGSFLRARVRCRSVPACAVRGRAVAFTNEQHRKRYAEDPEHREHKLAANRVYRAKHRGGAEAVQTHFWLVPES